MSEDDDIRRSVERQWPLSFRAMRCLRRHAHRRFQITARLHSGDQLEIIKVQSVKEGKLYDIHYYCDVCSITAYVPGLCPCCRNELEFRETPP